MTHLVRWLLGATIVGAVLAIGSLDTGVLCVVTAVLGGIVALGWSKGEAIAVRPAATLLFVTAVVLTAYTALQTIPLPFGLVAALSPHAADIWAHAFDPMKEAGPSAIPLSLDPPSTRVEVLRGVAYTLAFVAALRVAHKRDGALFLERTVVVSALVLATVSAIHLAVGAHEVFGIYKPHARDVTIIAPLLNVNQLAGYFAIGACVAFGSMLSSNPLAPRVFLALATLVLLAGIIWLGPRGATGSVAFGLLVCLVLAGAVRRSMNGLRVAIPVLVAMAGVGMVAFAASPTARQELGDTDVSKLGVQWHALRSMAHAYPIFGAGRGAFEATFQEYRLGTGNFVFTHPENFAVQWISEWGVPLALLGLVAIAWALRPTVLFARSQPPIGVWAALVALAVNNLVDFSSETPGVVLTLVICAALVVSGTSDGSARWRIERWARAPRMVAAFAGTLAMLGLVMGLTARVHDLGARRTALRQDSTNSAITNESFFAALRSELLAHPAEPYFPYLGAARTWAHVPNGNVVAWIDRTLERSPVYPPAHLLLARWLRPRSRHQALLEYRLAAEQDAAQVAAEAEGLVGSYEDVIELTPSGKAALPALDTLAEHVALRLPSTRVQIDRDILARDPNASKPLVRAAIDAFGDLRDAPWCTEKREECATEALRAAKTAQEHSDLCASWKIEAEVKREMGDNKGALDVLASASDQVTDRPECLRALGEMAIAVRDDTRATDAIEKLADATCLGQTECVQNILMAAGLEETRGNRARALLLYRRALEQAPERDDLLELVGARARAAGLHGIAADTYGKLAIRHPENSTYAKAAKEESMAIRP